MSPLPALPDAFDRAHGHAIVLCYFTEDARIGEDRSHLGLIESGVGAVTSLAPSPVGSFDASGIAAFFEVGHVLGMRSNTQMLGTAARWVVAEVHDFHPDRDRADEVLIGRSVGVSLFRDIALSVPGTNAASGPKPAVTTLVEPTEEAVKVGLIHSKDSTGYVVTG